MEDDWSRFWVNMVIIGLGVLNLVLHDSLAFRFLGVALMLQGGSALWRLRRKRQAP